MYRLLYRIQDLLPLLPYKPIDLTQKDFRKATLIWMRIRVNTVSGLDWSPTFHCIYFWYILLHTLRNNILHILETLFRYNGRVESQISWLDLLLFAQPQQV